MRKRECDGDVRARRFGRSLSGGGAEISATADDAKFGWSSLSARATTKQHDTTLVFSDEEERRRLSLLSSPQSQRKLPAALKVQPHANASRETSDTPARRVVISLAVVLLLLL